MLLFLIRHGDPVYNPDSLTPLGVRQAEAVAKRLCLYGIDNVFTSTSKRAIQTAIPTCEILKKEHTELDWCNESHAWRNFTVVNEDGKRTWMSDNDKCRELFVSEEIRMLGDNWFEHPFFKDTNCKGGIEFINKNVDEFLSALGYVHNRKNHTYHNTEENEERIALFAHSGFTNNFLSSVLDIPYPMFCTHFAVTHTGMTVIKFDNKETLVPKILTFSNDSHLYKEGLPTKFNQSVYF